MSAPTRPDRLFSQAVDLPDSPALHHGQDEAELTAQFQVGKSVKVNLYLQGDAEGPKQFEDFPGARRSHEARLAAILLLFVSDCLPANGLRLGGQSQDEKSSAWSVSGTLNTRRLRSEARRLYPRPIKSGTVRSSGIGPAVAGATSGRYAASATISTSICSTADASLASPGTSRCV